MFHVTDLIAEAAPARWQPAGVDPVAELLARARGRTHRVARPGVAPLALPRDVLALTSLESVLRGRTWPTSELHAISEALTNPSLRLPGPAREGAREYHLGAATTCGESAALALVTLKLRSGSRRRQPELFDACVDTADLTDVQAVRRAMADLYRRTEAPDNFIAMRGRRRAPLAAWIGSPPETEERLPSDWRDDMRAIAATFGYRLAVLAQPGVDLAVATRQVHDPELVVIWEPWVGSTKVDAAIRRAVKRAHIAEVDASTWQDARDELLVWLEVQEVRYRAEASDGPGSVSEALAVAAEELSEHVEVLESAYVSAAASPFRRPGMILQGIRLIDEVAREWVEDGLPGGFTPAFRRGGIDFAADVSDTAKREYGSEYTIQWQGEAVLMGPHLRFGVGSPETCARIYWYVDRARRKIAIGHVGRHLPDAGAS